MRDLDDLKAKLVSVAIVALGILFLGQAVTASKDTDLLPLGIAIAAVVVALTGARAAITGPEAMPRPLPTFPA